MSTISISPFDARRADGAALRAPQVRLTRRGRVVVFVAALLVVMAGALFLGTASTASNEPGVEQQTEIVMVGYGETLWDISASLAEDGDVRKVMEQIKDLNALDSSMLVAGQELHVPVTD